MHGHIPKYYPIIFIYSLALNLSKASRPVRAYCQAFSANIYMIQLARQTQDTE